ncbi:T9SS type B sorting domain-containing protein [Chitinophaga sp. SYP-B3965]|nr:T9SS type B sorting domain-containing protein [Chitinophaga sp. SYP-B3965]
MHTLVCPYAWPFMKKYLLFLLFFLSFQPSFSQQKQWYQWYYGKGVGLDFRTTGPTMLTTSALNQMEGSASVADDNGELLFYTDGVTVYNKLHQVMVNGTGLKGHASSTQSALIVPKPDDKNIYYIFTVPWEGEVSTSGLTYSEVDIRLDGGNGAVTAVKNVLLTTNCYEKLGAVKHCNNRDVWVTTYLQTNNTFISYLVTPAGISTMPVVSGTGMQMMPLDQTVGYLRYAPNGRKMAAAFYELGFQIFDFNNQTGELTNPITFYSWAFPANYLSPYGLEFSRNCRSLYVSSSNSWGGGGEMLSMDITNFNRNDIVASVRQVLPWDDYREVFSLALAPDNRIYVAEKITGTYTSVLTDPDNRDRPGYSVYNFRTGGTTLGLPNIIAGDNTDNSAIINLEPVCNQLSTVYSFTSLLPPDSVHWHFGDGSDTTRVLSGTHQFPAEGMYTISLIRYYPCHTDTLWQDHDMRLPVVHLGNDTAVCAGKPLTLKGDLAGTAYYWSSGQTTPELAVTQSGLYWLEVTYGVLNCKTRDQIYVDFKPYPVLKALSDTFICDNIPLQLDVSIAQPGALYYWQQVQQSPATSISNSGTYHVRISLNGCDTATSFRVEQDALPRFSLGENTKLCYNDKLLLDQSQYNYPQYTWQDGSHAPQFRVTQPGKYYLETANRCGTYSDTLIIEEADCEPEYVFPTAFSPNKDGVNDLLRPVFRGGPTGYLLQVFSRWGNLLYRSTNPQQGWDGRLNGTLMPAGSYVWHLQYRTLKTKELKQNMGSVLLIH